MSYLLTYSFFSASAKDEHINQDFFLKMLLTKQKWPYFGVTL